MQELWRDLLWSLQRQQDETSLVGQTSQVIFKNPSAVLVLQSQFPFCVNILFGTKPDQTVLWFMTNDFGT
jgi:hypothetical protein